MAVFTSIGAAIFGAGTFGATITAGILQTVAGIGLSLIGRALAGQEKQDRRFSAKIQLRSGDATSRSIGVGFYATAGSLVYYNTWGSANMFATQVIAISDYPIQTYGRVFIDGSPVTLLTGSPHADYGIPVSEYRKDGTDHLWIKFYTGSQTTADAFLVADVASAERPYTSDRVGYGVAYVIVTARAPQRNDGEEKPLFNGFPQCKFEIAQGAALFDPSDDDHDPDDAGTWGGAGDHSPAVQLFNLLRGITYDGEWLYGLQNMHAARLPASDWAAQIEKAATLVKNSDDEYEPEYRSGGEISVNAQTSAAVDALLTSMQGRLINRGGIYKLRLGAPDDPVASIADADIISTSEQRFAPFFSLADTINGASATYPSPAAGWVEKSSPQVIRTDLESLVGGRRLMSSVALDMVPYPDQVQRLLNSAILEAQRERRHTIVLGPEYWGLEPGDIIEFSSDRWGYTDKLFRIDGYVDRANLDVMIEIVEVDPDDYAVPDYVPEPTGPVSIVTPPPLPMTGWAVAPAIIYDEQERARRPSIEVQFAGGLADVQTVRVQVRTEGETNPFFDGEVPYGPPYKVILSGQFPPNTRLEVRGIFVRQSGMEAEWSSWLAVTTDNIKLGAVDVEASAIVGDVLNQMGQIRSLIEAFKDLGTTLEATDLENFNKRESMFREISVQMGNLEASFTEIIEVALGPGGAIATALESLYAAMGSNTSEVNVRWQAVAAPTGYSARYAVQAAVNDGTFRSATFFLDVPSNPLSPTRIGLAAGQTVFFTSGGEALALIGDDGVFRSANDVVQIDMIDGNFSITVP